MNKNNVLTTYRQKWPCSVNGFGFIPVMTSSGFCNKRGGKGGGSYAYVGRTK